METITNSMDFYQLSYFKKVCEMQSLSRAAELLRITQPAVSKQIKALEEELGEKLFDRIGRKVFLTRAGDVLYGHADRILRSVQEAKTAVSDMASECAGELIIGTSDHISIHRLPGVLKACLNAFPRIDLKLRCHRSETILDMVAKNQVDLGVITLQKTSTHIISRTIWQDPMSLIVPAGHPLASVRRIRLKDIIPYGLILTEAGTETRKMIDAVFAGKRLTPNVAMEVAYIETIKSLVKTGLGIAFLPDKAVEAELQSRTLVCLPIADASISRNLGAVYLKDKFLSRPAVEFLRLLEKA